MPVRRAGLAAKRVVETAVAVAVAVVAAVAAVVAAGTVGAVAVAVVVETGRCPTIQPCRPPMKSR